MLDGTKCRRKAQIQKNFRSDHVIVQRLILRVSRDFTLMVWVGLSRDVGLISLPKRMKLMGFCFMFDL